MSCRFKPIIPGNPIVFEERIMNTMTGVPEIDLTLTGGIYATEDAPAPIHASLTVPLVFVEVIKDRAIYRAALLNSPIAAHLLPTHTDLDVFAIVTGTNYRSTPTRIRFTYDVDGLVPA